MERNISCKVHFISHTQSALMPSIIFYYYDIALQFFFFNFAYSPLYHAFIYLPLIFYQFCFVLSQYNWVSLLLLRSNALFFCIFQFKKRLHAIIFMKRTQNTSFIARFFLWITWFGSLSSFLIINFNKLI